MDLVSSMLASVVVAAIITSAINAYTKIRSVKEAGLYTKRAEVLDGLMKRMESLHRTTGEMISFFQDDGSSIAENLRRAQAKDSFNNFSEYFECNRHYLSKDLSTTINALCGEYKKLFLDFVFDVRPDGERADIKKWREVARAHQEALVKKKEDVANEFRKIIGVK